ncbi:MAG: NifU family protein [Pseudomonadota bacterium]
MLIETEATPNPATLKFLPGRDVLGSDGRSAGGMDFPTPASAAGASPLAEALFAVDGVDGVFLGDAFISVTKADMAEWGALKPTVLGVVMEHFVANRPVLNDAAASSAASPADAYEGDDAEVVEQIVELLETRVRPAVAQDGGDIVFHSYEPGDGVVHLHMRGACAGCPSSTMTLKSGIENLLKHYVPEVTRVEPVL